MGWITLILVFVTSFFIVKTLLKMLNHFGGVDGNGQYRGFLYGITVAFFTWLGLVGFILIIELLQWLGRTYG